MVNARGPVLPVVHIRIVCEQEPASYPCDFCHKSFVSDKSRAHHIHTEHESVDTQEVYVCFVCRSCLLSWQDLLEHVSVRHQIQVAEGNEECKICEYCGMQLSSRVYLTEHCKFSHPAEFHRRGCSPVNIVELTLTDISKIGLGDQKCKTLFKVIEIPYEENSLSKNPECTVTSSSNVNIIKFDVENTTDSNEYLDNVKCRQEQESGEVSANKESPFNSACEINISEIEESSDLENQDVKDSEIEMTIKCESDELAASTTEGELILTVESEEKLVWNKDIMSQVICSSGILGRTKAGNEPDMLVEEVCRDLSDLDPVSLSTKRKEEEEEEKEVIVQLFSKDDNRVEHRHVAGEQSSAFKSVVINNTGRKANMLSRNDDNSQMPSQRRRACCVCGTIFSNLEMLEKHEGSVHGVRIKCELCDDSFAFSKSLRTHYMRKHNDAKDFECKVCAKLFKSRSNLWSHQLTHDQNARKYECQQCYQKFHSKSKLSNHLQSHSGKKKYQCGECDKGFLYPSLLLSHMEKHFSEAHKDLTENESLYLVEVETEDVATT